MQSDQSNSSNLKPSLSREEEISSAIDSAFQAEGLDPADNRPRSLGYQRNAGDLIADTVVAAGAGVLNAGLSMADVATLGQFDIEPVKPTYQFETVGGLVEAGASVATAAIPVGWASNAARLASLAGKTSRTLSSAKLVQTEAGLVATLARSEQPVARALNGLGQVIRRNPLKANLARGAVVDFVAFDEHEARLSDLVTSLDIPLLDNAVTQALASDKDDSWLEGRAKNALEGAGLGILFDLVGKLVKGVRGTRKAVEAGKTPDEIAKHVDAVEKSISDERVFVDAVAKTYTPEELSRLPSRVGEIVATVKTPDGAEMRLRGSAPELRAAAKKLGGEVDWNTGVQLVEDGPPAAKGLIPGVRRVSKSDMAAGALKQETPAQAPARKSPRGRNEMMDSAEPDFPKLEPNEERAARAALDPNDFAALSPNHAKVQKFLDSVQFDTIPDLSEASKRALRVVLSQSDLKFLDNAVLEAKDLTDQNAMGLAGFDVESKQWKVQIEADPKVGTVRQFLTFGEDPKSVAVLHEFGHLALGRAGLKAQSMALALWKQAITSGEIGKIMEEWGKFIPESIRAKETAHLFDYFGKNPAEFIVQYMAFSSLRRKLPPKDSVLAQMIHLGRTFIYAMVDRLKSIVGSDKQLEAQLDDLTDQLFGFAERRKDFESVSKRTEGLFEYGGIADQTGARTVKAMGLSPAADSFSSSFASPRMDFGSGHVINANTIIDDLKEGAEGVPDDLADALKASAEAEGLSRTDAEAAIARKAFDDGSVISNALGVTEAVQKNPFVGGQMKVIAYREVSKVVSIGAEMLARAAKITDPVMRQRMLDEGMKSIDTGMTKVRELVTTLANVRQAGGQLLRFMNVEEAGRSARRAEVDGAVLRELDRLRESRGGGDGITQAALDKAERSASYYQDRAWRSEDRLDEMKKAFEDLPDDQKSLVTQLEGELRAVNSQLGDAAQTVERYRQIIESSALRGPAREVLLDKAARNLDEAAPTIEPGEAAAAAPSAKGPKTGDPVKDTLLDAKGQQLNQETVQGLTQAGATAEGVGLLQKMVKDGVTSAEELSRFVVATKEKPEAVLKLINASTKPTLFNKYMELWMSSVLSGVRSLAANFLGGVIQTTVMPMKLAAGGRFNDAAALLAAHLDVLHRMFRGAESMERYAIMSPWDAAKKAFKEQSPVLDAKHSVTGEVAQGVAGAKGAISGRKGDIIRLPLRIMGMTDEFFKQLNYQAYLSYKAHKDGLDLVSKGHLKQDALSDWVTNRMAEGFDFDGKAAQTASGEAKFSEALQWAERSTFSEALKREDGFVSSIGASLQRVASDVPAIKLILPFIRTPTNILNEFVAMTPGLNLTLKSYRERLFGKRGAQEAAMARGEMLLGSAAYTGLGMAAAMGVITGTGPANREERARLLETGWKPYSVRLPDGNGGFTYIEYRKIDPISTVAGIVADLVDGTNRAIQAGDYNAASALKQLGNGVFFSLTQNIVNKTYMIGVRDFLDAVSQTETGKFERFLANRMASHVPAILTNVPAHGEEMVKIRGMVDAVMARLPGGSAGLPPRRNIFGEPITTADWMRPSPVALSYAPNDPVAQEIADLGFGFSLPPERWQGVNLVESYNKDGRQAYDRWHQLHNEVQVNGKTLKQAVKALIESQQYQNLPAPTGTADTENLRIRAIRKVITGYRKAAFGAMLKEHPEVMDERRSLLDAANPKLPPRDPGSIANPRAALEALAQR